MAPLLSWLAAAPAEGVPGPSGYGHRFRLSGTGSDNFWCRAERRCGGRRRDGPCDDRGLFDGSGGCLKGRFDRLERSFFTLGDGYLRLGRQELLNLAWCGWCLGNGWLWSGGFTSDRSRHFSNGLSRCHGRGRACTPGLTFLIPVAGKGCRYLGNVVDAYVCKRQFLRSPTVDRAYRKVTSRKGGLHVVGSVPNHGALHRTKLIPHLAEHHCLRLARATGYADHREQVADACPGQDYLGIPRGGVAAHAEFPSVQCQSPEDVCGTRVQLTLRLHVLLLQEVELRGELLG